MIIRIFIWRKKRKGKEEKRRGERGEVKRKPYKRNIQEVRERIHVIIYLYVVG